MLSNCNSPRHYTRVRIFNEFFLALPTAHFIFGVTVAGKESRVYRILTHRFMTAAGKISYAAYLLQFPLWSYLSFFESGTFKGMFPPCDRYDPEDAKSWQGCFEKRRTNNRPDVLVIWNVFLLFVVAFLVNRYFEQPVVAWLGKKLL